MGYISQIQINTDTALDIAAVQMAPSAAAGNALNPVYINSNGVPTAVDMSASGNRGGVIPFVTAEGVMDIGQYIDFQNGDANTGDYSIRLFSTVNTATTPYGYGLRLLTPSDNPFIATKTLRNISYGTADPSGGVSGDVYIQYT